MDPVTGALLGGVVNTLFAPKPKYVVPDYQAIRNKAEKAGFNPLTALTLGPQGSVVQGQNYMGAAISDALLIAAGDKEKDARISFLEAQTANYKKVTENMTLRPKVGGIYSQGKSAGDPSNAVGSNQGNKNANDPSDGPLPLFVDTRGSTGTVGLGVNPDGADFEQLAGAYVQDYLLTGQKHWDAAVNSDHWAGPWFGGYLNSRTAQANKSNGYTTNYDSYGRPKLDLMPKRRPPPDVFNSKTQFRAVPAYQGWETPKDVWAGNWDRPQ